MSPIAKALRRQTAAERLDARIYTNLFPDVVDEFAMLMLRIAAKLACGVAPASVKGGGT
jgi:hypothetical protein